MQARLNRVLRPTGISRSNSIWWVTILLGIAFFGTVATARIILDSPNSTQEQTECDATEVFRWSDQMCYVPQGE